MAIKGGKHRRWPEESKRALLAEAGRPGESLAGVARRHGIHVNMLYAWRAAAKASSPPATGGVRATGFVPLAIAAAPTGAASIELETASGARLKISAADASSVAA